jgi:hypothetical protein
MKKIFFALLFLLAIGSTAQASEVRSDRQKAYLAEMRQTLLDQEVDARIMEVADDYLISVGKMYCVLKNDALPDSYDRMELHHLKMQEEQTRDHPMRAELNRYYPLVQLIHRRSAEKHLCPGSVSYP